MGNLKSTGRSILVSLVYTSFLCLSCENDAGRQSLELSIETLLTRQWQFDALYVNGVALERVLEGFEPTRGFEPYPGHFLMWYSFAYNSDHTYELRSDWERTSYGYEHNYQPEYGYWKIDEALQLLIHNPGMPYEKHYRILELTETSFIREYERVVYESSSHDLWKPGNTVTYREVFQIRTGPCCDPLDE